MVSRMIDMKTRAAARLSARSSLMALFVAACVANANGADDVLWVPGKNR